MNINPPPIILPEQKSSKIPYKPSDFDELERIDLISEYTHKTDVRLLEGIYDKINKSDGLVVIDYGCADGTIAESRFGGDDRIAHVFCFDTDDKAIDRGKESGRFPNKISYHLISNGERPSKEIAKAMSSLGYSGADVVYISFMLHHQSRPVTLLKQLRRNVVSGGYILARSPDDGSEIAYPDTNNLVEEICRRYAETPGISDRYAGRKLYSQFRKAGLTDIHANRDMIDSCSMSYDEKLDAFDVFFRFRINAYLKLLEQNPSSQEIQESYLWMKHALDDLEEEITEESFWFCVFDYTITGRKP